jgi:phage head maturation protease
MSTAAIAFRKPPTIGHRFADLKASSFDPEARTVEATLSSAGAEVRRSYGTEVLIITPSAVDLSRLETCGVPLLDSHNIFSVGAVFGRVARVWFDRGSLMGLLSFDDSENGEMASGLVSRGTIRGISIGYNVSEWRVTNSDGDVVDPSRLRWDDQDDCTFSAVKWQLLEASLTSVPADKNAITRSLGSSPPIGAAAASDILARMSARQRIAEGNHTQDTEASLPLQRRRRYPGQIWRGGA